MYNASTFAVRRRKLLTFEGELHPRSGKDIILGVGCPPAQSQQGGPEDEGNKGHGEVSVWTLNPGRVLGKPAKKDMTEISITLRTP